MSWVIQKLFQAEILNWSHDFMEGKYKGWLKAQNPYALSMLQPLTYGKKFYYFLQQYVRNNIYRNNFWFDYLCS